jgi:hypothetical protein
MINAVIDIMILHFFTKEGHYASKAIFPIIIVG